MSAACGLCQNHPAEQEFIVHFMRSLSEVFEGCNELSALSKQDHASSQSTSKASPQFTLGLSWIRCVCEWVYEKESVRSAYCVRERSRPAQESHQCLTKEHTWHSHHVCSAKAYTYISFCTLGLAHAVITIHYSACLQQVDIKYNTAAKVQVLNYLVWETALS